MKNIKKIGKYLLTRTVIVHMICWLIFISYELFTLFYTFKKLDPPYYYILYYSLNIALFYAQCMLLNYVFGSSQNKIFSGFLYFLLIFLSYLTVKTFASFIVVYIKQAKIDSLSNYKALTIGNTFRGVWFIILATFYWAAGHLASFRQKAIEAEKQHLMSLKEQAELEASLMEAKNAYMTQQLSPHLLFNALNSIYYSFYKYSRKASRSVMLLSDIMRFSLDEPGTDGKIALEDESLQIRRLLDLNAFRFDGRQSVDFTTTGNLDNHRIIPLILFTLTENVLKHGHFEDESKTATITLTVEDINYLQFVTVNYKKPNTIVPERKGTGLENLRIRLEFSYSGMYSLDISQTNDIFEVALNLLL